MKQVKKEETKQTYDELVALNTQLINQCRMLQDKLKKDDISMMFARLDYLFKVLEHKDNFNPAFLNSVSKEIARIMDIPNDKRESQDEDK